MGHSKVATTINIDEAAKSLYSVSFRKFRVDSIAFAGGTPALPELFTGPSIFMVIYWPETIQWKRNGRMILSLGKNLVSFFGFSDNF